MGATTTAIAGAASSAFGNGKAMLRGLLEAWKAQPWAFLMLVASVCATTAYVAGKVVDTGGPELLLQLADRGEAAAEKLEAAVLKLDARLATTEDRFERLEVRVAQLTAAIAQRAPPDEDGG